jgi:O-acetyl-ADP-ribose deacetylase (regulator of RNase III)
MIKVHVGDLLSVQRGLIVHGCNAQGVMGSGVAKAIRDKYPAAYYKYQNRFAMDGLNLGQIVWHVPQEGLLIANAITQDKFGGTERHVDYWAIRKAFQRIKFVLEGALFTSGIEAHFPMIGAGLANGDWKIISKIIDETIPDEMGKNLWVLNDEVAAEVMAGSSEIHVIELESSNEQNDAAGSEQGDLPPR